MAKKTISVGIICFNEGSNVLFVHKALSNIANLEKKYNFEFVFVDNGSTDNTKSEIWKIAGKDKRVVGVFLSRNFGPESSTQASLDYASGNTFILYEGDMQDPPDIIRNFIREWEKGFDVVIGIRTRIEDSPLMAFIRKSYYRIFKTMSNIEVPVDAGSFGLLDRKVMSAIKQMPEKYRFYRGLRAWVGFSTSYVKYERRKRQRGKSSYNFLGYIHHAERSFFGFSYLPLDLIVYAGLLLVLLSFVWVIALLVSSLIFGQAIKDLNLILFSIILFGGVQLLALSIIGKYIQVIVEETKNRPVYIVEDIINKK